MVQWTLFCSCSQRHTELFMLFLVRNLFWIILAADVSKIMKPNIGWSWLLSRFHGNRHSSYPKTLDRLSLLWLLIAQPVTRATYWKLMLVCLLFSCRYDSSQESEDTGHQDVGSGRSWRDAQQRWDWACAGVSPADRQCLINLWRHCPTSLWRHSHCVYKILWTQTERNDSLSLSHRFVGSQNV